jgi:hypothetical protein
MQAKTVELYSILTRLIAQKLFIESVLPEKCLNISANVMHMLDFEFNFHETISGNGSIIKVY